MRSQLTRLGLLLLLAFLALTDPGCSRGSKPQDSSQQGPTRPEWGLTLDVDGTALKVPLEVMDVFLVEDKQYAETFEIRGNGTVLVGEFPVDTHVGYETKWEVLLNKTIALSPSGGDAREPKESILTLPAVRRAMSVTGGTFVAEKVSGKYAGQEGDKTLSGRITIQVRTEAGEQSISGTFAVHVASWG